MTPAYRKGALPRRHRLRTPANQIEYDFGRLEGDLENVEEEIESIEDRLDKETALQNKLDDCEDRLENLRGKIERIETQAIEEFNDNMDSVLEILEYDNLERI